MIEPVSVHVLTIANRVEELRRMSAWLADVGEKFGVTPEVLFKLDTCANEAVFNIMSYAYEDDSNHEISLELLITVNSASLTIRDDGRPFDPSTASNIAVADNLSDARIGGLGILLIRKLASRCHYERIGTINVLSLESNSKNLSTHA
jgi:serine/threonine-protein kinase RsbW